MLNSSPSQVYTHYADTFDYSNDLFYSAYHSQ